MKLKPQKPTHSQTLGIVWLSIGLLLIGIVVFFSSRHSDHPPKTTFPIDSTAAFSGYERRFSTADGRSGQKHANHPMASRHTPYQPDFPSAPSSPSYDTLRRPSPTPHQTRQPLVVELNSADSLTLQLLHGIGPAYARRIVNYRNRLGGFHHTDQLLEVYGFTPELLGHILPSLTLDTSAIRPLSINSASLKSLIRHPYMEYYQARDIVALRNSGVRFRSPDDLRAIPSMADSTLQRILPYIDFSDSHDSTSLQ